MSKFKPGQQVRVVGHTERAADHGSNTMATGVVCIVNNQGNAVCPSTGLFWATSEQYAAHKFELVSETTTSEAILDYLKQRLEGFTDIRDSYRGRTITHFIQEILTDCYGITAEVIPAQVRYS